MRRAGTCRLYLAGKRDGAGGDGEYRGEHRKGIAEAITSAWRFTVLPSAVIAC
jgi:hypothetical protein